MLWSYLFKSMFLGFTSCLDSVFSGRNGWRLYYCCVAWGWSIYPPISFFLTLNNMLVVLYFQRYKWVSSSHNQNFNRSWPAHCVWDPTKKGQWALRVYSIANFVASWLKWLQMIWNDSKWVCMCLKNQLKSFEFIWNH